MSILEIAAQFAEAYGTVPGHGASLRFCWWGGEEEGLLGSTAYVEDLAQKHPDQLKKIVANLNFDMLASPNFVRGQTLTITLTPTLTLST